MGVGRLIKKTRHIVRARSTSVRRFIAAWGAVALVGVGLFACGDTAPEPKTSAAASSPASARTAEPARASSPASSAEPAPTSGAASSPPSAESNERPQRTGASGSTQKTIACGAARCAAGTQVCEWNEGAFAWTCAPSKGKAPGDEEAYFCDDASDCGAGQGCCRRDVNSEVYSCQPRKNGVEQCYAEICVPGEGAACPKGESCVSGVCIADSKALCADKKPCPADRPVCLWSKSPSCVGWRDAAAAQQKLSDQAEGAPSVYACTRPSDCGDRWHCVTSSLSGMRYANCANDVGGLDQTTVLCERDADCIKVRQAACVGRPNCRVNVKCERPAHDELLQKATPPWVKICAISELGPDISGPAAGTGSP